MPAACRIGLALALVCCCAAAGLHLDPPEFDMRWARVEAELVMFNAVRDLLAKTKLSPRQIDVLGETRMHGWVGKAVWPLLAALPPALSTGRPRGQ